MGIIHSFLAIQGAREINELAVELSRRAWPRIWERVEGRASRMGTSEARGYVRAHCSAIVQQMVDTTLENNRKLGEWARESLTERVIDNILEQASLEIQRLQRGKGGVARAA